MKTLEEAMTYNRSGLITFNEVMEVVEVLQAEVKRLRGSNRTRQDPIATLHYPCIMAVQASLKLHGPQTIQKLREYCRKCATDFNIENVNAAINDLSQSGKIHQDDLLYCLPGHLD